MQVQLVNFLFTACFELLSDVTVCGIVGNQFSLLFALFLFKFMHQIISTTDAFGNLSLCIDNELKTPQVNSWMWHCQILSLLEFLD